ncbi:MAG TPA: hypothetical protein PLZ12_04820 [Saprospiraceae bacterium]|nr:hypothetical protein [Saprospiraceae bacterium]
MARIIPPDFDIFKEDLDSNERHIRDDLQINIVNWAKFRYSIHAGNDSSVLVSPLPIPDNVRKAFVELAKSHYEAVNSIGYAKINLIDINMLNKGRPDYLMRVFKGMKEFYVHIGSLFDNLARLIFILNTPDSANKKKNKNSNEFLRHWIDWNQLKGESNLQEYSGFFQDKVLKEILNIRNNYTHNWRPPFGFDKISKIVQLPLEMRSDRNYVWGYEEKSEMEKRYKQWKPLEEFLMDDFAFAEKCQEQIFQQLILDIADFEFNNKVVIRH